MAELKLTHPSFERELTQSFTFIEDAFRYVLEVYPKRFFTGAIGQVNTLKHNAPWTPDEVIFVPWSLTAHVVATEAARKGWSDVQIGYETDTADVACTAYLIKATAIDQDRTRTAVNTSTGGSAPDALGTPSAGVGNDDGTVSGSGADQVDTGRSNF